MPHTARQIVYDAVVHGWTLHWQDVARRPAVATDMPVALDPSGVGPQATSIFSVTLSDARDWRGNARRGAVLSQTLLRRSSCQERADRVVLQAAGRGVPYRRRGHKLLEDGQP
jgi:hypothetical protein